MGRGKKVLVSCRLSSSSSSLKFLLIMIQLIVVYQFASTWRFTSHHPWLWNAATTIRVKIPEISVLDHSSPPLNAEAAQSQPPPAAPELYRSSGTMGKHSFQNHPRLSCRAADSLGNYDEDRGIIPQNAKTAHQNLSVFDDLPKLGRLQIVSCDGPWDPTRDNNNSSVTLSDCGVRCWKNCSCGGDRPRNTKTSPHGIVINTGRNNWRLWITISGIVILMLFIVLFYYRRKLKDVTRKKLLDWKKRYNIIEGIAQRLLYLHKHSRLRIIHRDLKASNILLDHDMNPKISDFGMATIVRRNAIEVNTKRIVGTIGYMSPEYAMKGIFSVKSDVYSFGVLMLEIISGRKNKIFHYNDCTANLVGYAWDLWKEGRSLELVDPELGGSNSTTQMLRCIHVAMLCVQDNVANRPMVSDAIFMFTNETVPLPTPALPTAAVNLTGELGSATSLTISGMEGR